MAKRTLLRVMCPRVIAIVFTMTATTTWARISDFLFTPPQSQLTIGATYQGSPDLTGNTDPIQSYNWKIGSTIADCTLPETYIGSSASQTFKAHAPGIYNITLEVTYMDPGMGRPRPLPSILPKTVTIAAPDSFYLISPPNGVGVPVTHPGTITVKTKIHTGVVPAGPAIIGLVQEKLTNQIGMGMGLPDSLWGPFAPQPSLHLVGSEIHDEHASYTSSADFATVPVGNIFFSCKQHYRLAFSTGCTPNLPLTVPLGSWDFRFRKTDNTEYQLE